MVPTDTRRALELGPLWILSALTGTSTYFSDIDRAVLRDVIAQVVIRTPPGPRELLTSILAAGDDLYLDFELDDRSVVTGLRDVTTALETHDRGSAHDHKLALIRIGVGIARARGPYGRTVTPESEQQLRLLAELLELGPAPADTPV